MMKVLITLSQIIFWGNKIKAHGGINLKNYFLENRLPQ